MYKCVFVCFDDGIEMSISVCVVRMSKIPVCVKISICIYMCVYVWKPEKKNFFSAINNENLGNNSNNNNGDEYDYIS